MSIENNLKRIADALESIASSLEDVQPVHYGADVNDQPTYTRADVPTPEPPPAPTQEAPEPPKQEAPEPPKQEAPEPPPAPTQEAPQQEQTPDLSDPNLLTSPDELNKALVVEFQRLGNNREPIDRVMQEQFGVNSIKELPVLKYQALLDAVRQVEA